jgi:hypothetical protein
MSSTTTTAMTSTANINGSGAASQTTATGSFVGQTQAHVKPLLASTANNKDKAKVGFALLFLSFFVS